MILPDLPPEIIYLIASYFSTASALVNLAQTCHRLHTVVAAEDWRIFRAFVKSRFPYVQDSSFWKDAAQALTTRSRALDRYGVVGRFVLPSKKAVKLGSHRSSRRDNPTIGYRPAIDSYETWNAAGWKDHKEVLAWGAADEVVLRIRQQDKRPKERWFVFNDLDHISSLDDICGLHLLRPNHYNKQEDKEQMILGRLRGELLHLAIAPDQASWEYKQKFVTHGPELERIDLSSGSDPILAAHMSHGAISFYSTTTDESEVHAFARIRVDPYNSQRNKYSKFLSSNRFAVETGRPDDALAISKITQERLSLEREIGIESLELEDQLGPTPKPTVSGIAPLEIQAYGRPSGDVFLAAWGDRAVRYVFVLRYAVFPISTNKAYRLHDLRSDKSFESIYRDSSDQNPIYCVHSFGYDNFAAGAGGEGVVKLFDLRMPKNYNYLEARPSSRVSQTTRRNSATPKPHHPRGGLSLFLSHPPPLRSNAPRARSTHRYRGPIYTMTSPSILSPTIYTGVADGVFRLDFASTDDLTGPCRQWYHSQLGLDLNNSNSPNNDSSSRRPDRILELSGYERPDPRHHSRSLKLRTQQPFSSIGADDVVNERETGWDRRWERLGQPGAWRRSD